MKLFVSLSNEKKKKLQLGTTHLCLFKTPIYFPETGHLGGRGATLVCEGTCVATGTRLHCRLCKGAEHGKHPSAPWQGTPQGTP